MLRQVRQRDGDQRKQKGEVLPRNFIDHNVLRIFYPGILRLHTPMVPRITNSNDAQNTGSHSALS